MQVRKEELFTVAASLGIVKTAIKDVLPNYRSEVCDNIIFNSLSKAIAKKQAENKENKK